LVTNCWLVTSFLLFLLLLILVLSVVFG
jgi:hypothetical protein